MDQSFARRYRLTKTDEFSSVFGFRRAIRGQWLMLHYLPAAGDTARLGLVVGKKLLKKAVDRNRLKRIVRDHFRRERHRLPACDLITRLANRPAELQSGALAGDLQQLFDRLCRQKPKPATA